MVAMVTLSKVLGLVAIIPLTLLIGDVGLGIYANAYILYANLVTLSTAGFPTAMGKLISERLAVGRYEDVEQIYKVTIRFVLLAGFVLFILMWFGAPLYSYAVALQNKKASAKDLVWAIRALAPCLLVIPLMSALRGYLQGFQRLEPSAYSQAIEQFVRVIFIVVGAYLAMKWSHGNPASGATAATLAAFVGGFAGLIWLMKAVKPLRTSFLSKSFPRRTKISNRDVLKMMFKIALPVSLGAMVVPISGLVDSFTVQNILMWTGMSYGTATGQYGILTRQAMQLIQLPLAFAMAVGVAVLPAIASAKARKDDRSIEQQISGTFRSMLFMTIPVSAACLVLAQPIDEFLFHSHEGVEIIGSVSFMGIFSSTELISTYMLQGLGEMYRPVRNMFLGVGIKLIFNLFLIYTMKIEGAAIATTIGYLFSSTLNVLAVKKYSRVRISIWKNAIPSLEAGAILCVTLGLCGALWNAFVPKFHGPHQHLQDWLSSTGDLVVALSIGGCVYVFCSIWLGAVSEHEIKRLPLIGSRLSKLAHRIAR